MVAAAVDDSVHCNLVITAVAAQGLSCVCAGGAASTVPRYSAPMPRTPALPPSADGVLKLAAQCMFDMFAQTAMGMMVVDREHRIVWISEGYKRFLPALGSRARATSSASASRRWCRTR